MTTADLLTVLVCVETLVAVVLLRAMFRAQAELADLDLQLNDALRQLHVLAWVCRGPSLPAGGRRSSTSPASDDVARSRAPADVVAPPSGVGGES